MGKNLSTLSFGLAKSLRAKPSRSWKIGKYFIFRCAGFPFDLIEKIKFKNTYLAIATFLDGKQDNYCKQKLKSIFETELYKKRVQLQEIASTEKFQEAVFHQNQNDYQSHAYECILNFSKQKIEKEKRNYDSRQNDLLVYRYLQRFCTKNDTVSFFGPFYIGEFSNFRGKILLKKAGLNKINNRKTYISIWLLREILKKIASDKKILKTLKLRQVPNIFLDDDQALNLETGRKTELDRVSLKILKLISKIHRVKDICLELEKNGISEKEVLANIRRLIKGGILLNGLEISIKVDEPDEHLINRLSQNAAVKNNYWFLKLIKLSQFKRKFEKEGFAGRLRIVSQLNELFSPLVKKPRFKDIEFEKGFFSEYCEANFNQLKLGEKFRRDLQNDFNFLLDLASYNGIKINKINTQLLHDWLKNRFKKSQISVKDVIYKIAKDRNKKNFPFRVGNNDLSNVPFDNLPSDFLDIIDGYKESSHINLSRKDLESRLEKYLDKIDRPAATTCDILISSEDTAAINKGDYKIIFGEAHPMRKPLSVYNWYISTSSKGGQLTKEFSSIHKSIKKHYTLAELLNVANDRLDSCYDFSGLCEIEYGVYSQRRRNKINFSDLKLNSNGNFLSLVRSADEKPVILLTPLPVMGSLFSISAPAVSASRLSNKKTHFPRVKIDNLVFQRQQWVFPKNELFFAQESYQKKGVELWLELEEWRKRECLPKYFFIKTGSRAKVIFIDFENYFAIETFISFSKKTKERLCITEMLPGPENLWLRDAQGKYTCEFRLILYK